MKSSPKVETIRSNVDKLAQNVDQVKKMHSKLLTAAVQDQGIKLLFAASNPFICQCNHPHTTRSFDMSYFPCYVS